MRDPGGTRRARDHPADRNAHLLPTLAPPYPHPPQFITPGPLLQNPLALFFLSVTRFRRDAWNNQTWPRGGRIGGAVMPPSSRAGGHTAAADWITAHVSLYSAGLFRGFVSDTKKMEG